MWLRQDFGEFCAKLSGLSRVDMIGTAERAADAADSASVGNEREAVKAQAAGAREFVDRAGRLLFWLRHGHRPNGETTEDWDIYRSLTIQLVERGEMGPDDLARLDNPPRLDRQR